jgi:hypothetical protein
MPGKAHTEQKHNLLRGMTMAKTITLTDGANKKNGTSGDDIIFAKGGKDRIDGGGGMTPSMAAPAMTR